MKEIKINSVLTNAENETTNQEVIGHYNKEENYITYKEEELIVYIYINSDSIKLVRKNDDYNLNLEFKLNEKIKCNYQVKSVGLDIEITVYTKKLEIKENYIYIHYELFTEEKEMGIFEYKIMFWE